MNDDRVLRQVRMYAPRLAGHGCVLSGLLFACAEHTIDLRTPSPVPLECGDGARYNPETDRCSVCERVESTANEVCLCDSEPLPAEFPWCEGEEPFRCLSCAELGACRDYDPYQNVVWDCTRVRACCEEIEEASSGTPCCEPGRIAVCFDHPTIEDAFALECVAMAAEENDED